MRDITACKNLLKRGITREEIIKWDLGLKLHNEPCHHKLIEEQEDGDKKITHFKGDKKWITYEEVQS